MEIPDQPDPQYIVRSADELAALYPAPSERAVRKQLDHLDRHCRALIAASPFFTLGTQSEAGSADCSPRGDRPGFVQVVNDRTLLIPDRRGNNRLDSLRNIITNPEVALLFFVPGVNETLRVNGRAYVSTDPKVLEAHAVDGQPPRTVLIVRVREAFMQCSRALHRSELWNPARFTPRDALASIGTVMAAHTGGMVDAAEYDATAVTFKSTLY